MVVFPTIYRVSYIPTWCRISSIDSSALFGLVSYNDPCMWAGEGSQGRNVMRMGLFSFFSFFPFFLLGWPLFFIWNMNEYDAYIIKYLGGGFYFQFSPLPGEVIEFD